MSGWWRKLVAAVGGKKGRWFWGNLCKELGNGLSESFWEGSWLGNFSLKEKFPRLFQLSIAKEKKVGECGHWIEGRWTWDVAWRRQLRARESGWEGELLEEINRVTLKEKELDRWVWGRGSMLRFSVKEAYMEAMKKEWTERGSTVDHEGFSRVWKSIAPLKAQVMAWRLVWNRLPTREKMAEIAEISDNGQLCCCCNRLPESAEHLYLECAEVSSLWYKMVGWIGVSWLPPKSVKAHLLFFSSLLGGGIMRKRLYGFVLFG